MNIALTMSKNSKGAVKKDMQRVALNQDNIRMPPSKIITINAQHLSPAELQMLSVQAGALLTTTPSPPENEAMNISQQSDSIEESNNLDQLNNNNNSSRGDGQLSTTDAVIPEEIVPIEHDDEKCCEGCRQLNEQNYMLQVENNKLQTENNRLNNEILENLRGLNVAKGVAVVPKYPLEPFDDLETLKLFDADLKKNPNNQLKLENYIRSLGGENLQKKVSKAMSKVMTDNLAKQCSWTGQTKGSLNVSESTFGIIIRDVLQAASGQTEHDTEQRMANWLRRPGDRIRTANTSKERKQRQERPSS